jgi:hypothetical protein
MTKPRYYDSPVNVLADGIAERIGGKHVPLNPDGEYFEGWADILCEETAKRPGFKLSLSMRGYGVKKDTVTARISPLVLSNNVSRVKFPEASFDSKKTLDAIVKDVNRRVINEEAFAALREYGGKLAALKARENALQATLEQMRKDYPGAHFPEHGARDTSFQVCSGAATSGYFYATVSQYESGPSVHFERINPASFDQAKRILAILCEPTKVEE